MSNQPVMLVELNRLERFVPSSNRGVDGAIVIAGETFFQVTPSIAAKITAGVKRLIADDQVDPSTRERFSQAAKEIWNWACDYWGEDQVDQAWKERTR